MGTDSVTLTTSVVDLGNTEADGEDHWPLLWAVGPTPYPLWTADPATPLRALRDCGG